jgi:bacterioferritin (cytochrome b1)
MTFPKDKDTDDKIAILYLAGISTYKIARRMGKDWNSDRVLASLKRTNTPRRSMKEAQAARRFC